MSEEKYVYMFSEGSAELKSILGEKSANLAEMTRLTIPIPQGFTVTCPACIKYFDNPQFMEKLKPEIKKSIGILEKQIGKIFGDNNNPFLVSVRSGAPISMPGMMDSVLNVGINDKITQGLIKSTGNERFAYDTYRRFILMYSDIVMGIEQDVFEDKDEEIEQTAEVLKQRIKKYKKIYKEILGEDFPEDPYEQLFTSIEAIFNSWNRPRAKYYRTMHNIEDYGSSVTIQEMVYGNLDITSMTGIAFTRDPSTGTKKYMGEYLTLAQGEDVASTKWTPKKIIEMKREFPKVFTDLKKIMGILEAHFKDMLVIEFTVQERKLYILQAREGKLTATASVKIAIDLMKEGLLTKEQALLKVNPKELVHFLFKRIDNDSEIRKVTSGIGASPGAITGSIVFTAEDAETWANNGKSVILCRPQIKPDDIHGLMASKGILTVYGGRTCPAAVLSRGMGKPAVCGANDIFMDIEKKLFWVASLNHVFYEGDKITIDGSSGIIAMNTPDLIEPQISPEFKELLDMADNVRSLEVRGNAEIPTDITKAIEFGAEGIGLCRTEHMFMTPDRLLFVRNMIMGRSSEERNNILQKIKPIQKEDFKEIFRVAKGKPVTIRLLDPPLSEFLPDLNDISIEVALLRYRNEHGENVENELKLKEELLVLVDRYKESNVMLGLRGCRLGLIWPEINEMQVEAIIEACCELYSERITTQPEILIPFIGFVTEFEFLKNKLEKIANKIINSADIELNYKIGVLIEVPRSALIADEIALNADFFSFGTNDLTQMTLAFSRNDAEIKFLPRYLEKGILSVNPFEVLDEKGTGKLMKIAIEGAKKTKPNIEFGICGEHGGNPESIEFCHKIGLNYVSCSSYLVPLARLAAAQAELKFPRKRK